LGDTPPVVRFGDIQFQFYVAKILRHKPILPYF
jgi:hypothetical protein